MDRPNVPNFHLMRPNVFPETDLGLLKSIRKNYSLNDYASVREQLPNLKKMGPMEYNSSMVSLV